MQCKHHPLRLDGITNFDMLALVGACVLLWVFGLLFAKRTVTRAEGGIMALAYIAYVAVLLRQV